MKILNLYAGIGGNRKEWSNKHKVTAVEINPEIATIYKRKFPNDKVIVGDAHEYLREHYKEFDFIWSSRPCQSHSSFRYNICVRFRRTKPMYPDMKLYEEILLLQGYFKGKYVVENVKSWYKPLVEPILLQRHYFWANFEIPNKEFEKDGIGLTGGRNQHENKQIKKLQDKMGFDLTGLKGNKRTMLRNCVNPLVGKYILDKAINQVKTLF